MADKPSMTLGWKVCAVAFLVLGIAGLSGSGIQFALMLSDGGLGVGPAGFVVMGAVLPLIAGAGLTLLGILMLKPPRRD